jgi:uncharacterized protein YkwD
LKQSDSGNLTAFARATLHSFMASRPSHFVRVLVPIAFIAFVLTPLAQGRPAIQEIRDGLRLMHLQQINRERALEGLPAVRLDSHSSLIADAYCETQLREGTTGHYLTDGMPPYMRYSMAGGNDGLSQNVAAWSANYTFTDTMLSDLMQQSLGAMLAEVPPDDGHRRTILDPHATHIGIGLAWKGGEFRLTHEFIRRYVEWQNPPRRRATTSDRVLLSGRPLHGFGVEAISVYFEQHPQPMSVVLANRLATYSLPNERKDYHPRAGRTERFSFAVPFDRGPGVYTVVVWVRGEQDSGPIAASNISIAVTEPRQGLPGITAAR